MLTDSALAALEALVQEHQRTAMPDTPAHRFLFKFLAAQSAERWPLETLWKELTSGKPHDIGRNQSVIAAMNGVRRQVGR